LKDDIQGDMGLLDGDPWTPNWPSSDGQHVSILHCPSLNGVTIFGEVAIMVADSKDHEVVNWVWDSVKQWVNGKLQAKVLPDSPGVVLGIGLTKNDCGLTHFLCNVKIRAELIALQRWHSCQGFG
jgi:hypothetical protein